MIDIFQGTIGSGKSACATVDMLLHLTKGGVCASNYTLVDGWAEKYLSNNPLYRIMRGLLGSITDDRIRDLESRHRVVTCLSDIWRPDGGPSASRDLIPLAKGKPRQEREGWGRLYLDECQLVFNSRDWGDNMQWIHFFTQSRKLKWDVILIAHSISMIDKQIRPLIEFETRFRDLRKVKFLGFVPLAPKRFPIFLAITRYAGISAGNGVIAWRNTYPLQKHIADLYDSFTLFGQGKEGRIDSPSDSQQSSSQSIPQKTKKVKKTPLDSRICPGW